MHKAIGAAAFLAIAITMPVQQAAAQDALGGALLGGAAGAIVGVELRAHVVVDHALDQRRLEDEEREHERPREPHRDARPAEPPPGITHALGGAALTHRHFV